MNEKQQLRFLLAYSQRYMRKQVTLILLAQLLAMSLWFAPNAVISALINEWHLSRAEQASLTIGVQLGFASGALVIAVLNLIDRIPVNRLFVICAVSGALFSAAIAGFSQSPGHALALRFLTGSALAGVYPSAMKLITTWRPQDRGFWISLMIGALALGTALPHLINASPFLHRYSGPLTWRYFFLIPSILAVLSALIIARTVTPGPLGTATAKFHGRYVLKVLKNRPTRLVILGYLGHMWELYAMWTWLPFYLLTSYQEAGLNDTLASLAGFAAIAIGGLGSVVAGYLSAHYGRTRIAIISLLISGACTALSGLLMNSPIFLTILSMVWGFFVISDSPQFTAAVTELCDSRYLGTALAIQTSLGFFLTVFSIRLIPWMGNRVGPEWAFLSLFPGPLLGIWSLVCLRRLPDAAKLASGKQ